MRDFTLFKGGHSVKGGNFFKFNTLFHEETWCVMNEHQLHVCIHKLSVYMLCHVVGRTQYQKQLTVHLRFLISPKPEL